MLIPIDELHAQQHGDVNFDASCEEAVKDDIDFGEHAPVKRNSNMDAEILRRLVSWWNLIVKKP